MGGEWVVSGRPNLMYSPGPGLWSLVLGPFGPDLGPDLDLTWDLDLSLTIFDCNNNFYSNMRVNSLCHQPEMWNVQEPSRRLQGMCSI